MKKNYITPESVSYQIEMAQPLAGSFTIKTNNNPMMQYDGDQLHDDLKDGRISGPASEYVGTVNDSNPVDESSIFGD